MTTMQKEAGIDRAMLVRWWDEAWKGGLWYAPWSRTLEGLSAEQAAWQPAPERHSIWQIVNHICFWREYAMQRLKGKTLGEAEIQARNFEAPAAPTAEQWQAAQQRFADSFQLVREGLLDPATPAEKLQYLVAHDSYHIGQIMYLRAMQGMNPID